MKRFSRALLVCTLLVPTLSAAAPPAGTQLAKEQVFHRGNHTEPQSLDPHKSEGIPASRIHRDLFEGLLRDGIDSTPIPGVAESWTISDDGLLYTFKLRKNALWSNGDPVTAHDFAYSWQRLLNPETGSFYSQTLAPVLNAEAVIKGELPPEKLGIRVIDDHTFEVTLKGPTPYFLGLLTHHSTYPVHAASIKKHGGSYARPGNLVSNGAFVLHEWVVQSHIVTLRNHKYWDDANTTLEKVVYYPTEDLSTELKRYRAGQLHFTEEIPANQIRWVRENLGNEIHIAPWLGIYYYGYNLTKPPFKDNIKLRQALSMAIDREIITEKVLPFGILPAYGWVPPGVRDYKQDQEYEWKKLSREARHAMARKLYQEAGYSDAKPLETEIRYNTHENHKRLAVAIASMWKKVLGVKVRLVNEEWKVFLDNRKLKQVTQVFRAGWIADYNDAVSFIELLHSRHGINDSAYNRPEYDALVEASFQERDPAKRAKILAQAESMALADFPAIPIYYYTSKHLVKPFVGGYEDNIMDFHPNRYIYIKQH